MTLFGQFRVQSYSHLFILDSRKMAPVDKKFPLLPSFVSDN